jgi:hypothetical protein
VAREVAAALEKARGEDTKGEDTSRHEASSEPELQYLLQKTKLLEAQLGQAKWMGKCASMQFRMQTFLTDEDHRIRKAKEKAEAEGRRLAEVLQQMDDRNLMYRHDPRNLAYAAWSLETFGEDKHRKKQPKKRKKHARAGRPSKKTTARAKKRKSYKHSHESTRKRKSHKILCDVRAHS